MTRKEAKAILSRLDITNRFSLKTVNFNRDRMQVLTVKDWEPNFKLSGAVKEAFKPHRVIIEFEGPNILFS